MQRMLNALQHGSETPRRKETHSDYKQHDCVCCGLVSIFFFLLFCVVVSHLCLVILCLFVVIFNAFFNFFFYLSFYALMTL